MQQIFLCFLGEKKRQAFLDLLIESAENGVVLSDKEVREQVDTIMFEVRIKIKYFVCTIYVKIIQALISVIIGARYHVSG